MGTLLTVTDGLQPVATKVRNSMVGLSAIKLNYPPGHGCRILATSPHLRGG